YIDEAPAEVSTATIMSKMRINELARELEVKPGVILEMLPELGVEDKKTHSSTIGLDLAEMVRERLATPGSSKDLDSGGPAEAPSVAPDTPAARPESFEPALAVKA